MLHMMSMNPVARKVDKRCNTTVMFLPLPSIQMIVVQLIREVRLPLVGILKHSG